tara:strand:- start:31 stop:207 length:177 start_codon:yes stop_codon:yes gene_type:complete
VHIDRAIIIKLVSQPSKDAKDEGNCRRDVSKATDQAIIRVDNVIRKFWIPLSIFRKIV